MSTQVKFRVREHKDGHRTIFYSEEWKGWRDDNYTWRVIGPPHTNRDKAEHYICKVAAQRSPMIEIVFVTDT